MKIVWYSYHPDAPLSYGRVTARVAPELAAAGHQVVLAALGSGLGLVRQVWRGCEIVTLPYCGWLPALCLQEGSDRLVLCGDIHRINADVMQAVPTWAWVPVHHQHNNATMMAHYRAAHRLAVYSRFGAETLADLKPRIIPIPTVEFAPMISDMRHELGIDSAAFLVTMVGINHSTDAKGYVEALQGFALFAHRHADARLYLHTSTTEGIDLPTLAAQYGIQDRVLFPPQLPLILGEYDEAWMASLYSVSDVLLNTAHWEGFGMPLVEAQACGCPVIAPDYGPAAELVVCGERIPGRRGHMASGEEIYLADPEAVSAALERVYQTQPRSDGTGLERFSLAAVMGDLFDWLEDDNGQ